MSTTKSLTDTRLVILSHASQQPDLHVLPTPPHLKSNRGAVTRALNTLLRRGLIAEHPGSKPDQEWRRDENGDPLTLVVTPAGLAAIGVEAGEHASEASSSDDTSRVGESAGGSPEARSAQGASSDAAQRLGTKGAAITALLQRDAGATVAELTAASGWQAHSVRGFLSGTLKKKLGYAVTSDKSDDGVRRYRIAA